jgi:hypothetical protein
VSDQAASAGEIADMADRLGRAVAASDRKCLDDSRGSLTSLYLTIGRLVIAGHPAGDTVAAEPDDGDGDR